MPGRVVQPRHLHFPLTIPAGTGSLAVPTKLLFNAGHTVLRKVKITFPTGCVGLVGFAVELAGTRILPYTSTTRFITGNGQTWHFDLDVEIEGNFVFAYYNLDAYDHQLWIDLECDDLALEPPNQGPTAIVPIS